MQKSTLKGQGHEILADERVKKLQTVGGARGRRGMDRPG